MDTGTIVISAGALSSLLLQGIKYAVRKIKKDMLYDFPVAFYAIMLPLLNAVMPFVMVYALGMQMTDPILSMDPIGIVRYLVLIAIGALISMVTHDGAVKPMTAYAKEMQIKKESKELGIAIDKAIEEASKEVVDIQ